MKTFTSDSWFVSITKILQQYDLPSPLQLLESETEKTKPKTMFKKAVHSFWTHKMQNDCSTKTTLSYVNKEVLNTERPHPVWKTVSSNGPDVQRSYVKARLLTDSYMLEYHHAKFRTNTKSSGYCPLCALSIEDRKHFLIDCSVLYTARDLHIDRIRNLVMKSVSPQGWQAIVDDQEKYLSLILDCTSLKNHELKRLTTGDLEELECLTRLYCYALHLARLKNLQSCSNSTQPQLTARSKSTRSSTARRVRR